MPELEPRSHLRYRRTIEHNMPTGTKIAAIVLVVLLGAAGLYYAVVAPPAPNNKSAAAKESGAATGGTAVNGLSSQTPGTLAPAVPSVGAQPSPATSTPAIGTLGANGTAGSPTPVPTGLPAGTGTAGAREQPGFAPGSLSAGGTGKGDMPASARPAPAPAPGTTINGIPVSGGTGATTPTVGAVPASGTAPAVTPQGGPRPTSPTPAGVVPSGGVNGGLGLAGGAGNTRKEVRAHRDEYKSRKAAGHGEGGMVIASCLEPAEVHQLQAHEIGRNLRKEADQHQGSAHNQQGPKVR